MRRRSGASPAWRTSLGSRRYVRRSRTRLPSSCTSRRDETTSAATIDRGNDLRGVVGSSHEDIQNSLLVVVQLVLQHLLEKSRRGGHPCQGRAYVMRRHGSKLLQLCVGPLQLFHQEFHGV